MREIKIKFLNESKKKFIKYYLKDDVIFIESDTPDYVVFGPEQLAQGIKYQCVRLWISGENVRPDFNLVDYAIGFDDMMFGDRYLQFPYYMWPNRRETFEKAIRKHNNVDRDSAIHREFCGWIVSNGLWDNMYRDQIFDKLSQYKRIDSGGKYLNNQPDGECIPMGESLEFYGRHKFTLALENSKMPGYTTEKIIEAWAGGNVPIYWGDPDIEKNFSSGAFINANKYNSLDDLLAEVIRIDNDDDAYMRMLGTPILFPGSRCYEYMREEYVRSFLENIFEKQTVEQARRRLNSGSYWGSYVERDLSEFYQIREHQLIYRVVRKMSKLMKRKGNT